MSKNTAKKEDMDIPITFDEIEYKDLKKLPISDEGINSLILNGNTKSYPVWIPIWDLEEKIVKKAKFHVKPISQGDWDHCLGSQDQETSLQTLVISKSVVDEFDKPIGLEKARKLPIGSPVFLMKEIRKLSGHFEAPIY